MANGLSVGVYIDYTVHQSSVIINQLKLSLFIFILFHNCEVSYFVLWCGYPTSLANMQSDDVILT